MNRHRRHLNRGQQGSPFPVLGQTLKSMPAAILNVARIRDPDEPSEPFIKPSTRLRQLLAQDGICVQAAGVYDGICARIAIEEGFQVIVRDEPSPNGPTSPRLKSCSDSR